MQPSIVMPPCHSRLIEYPYQREESISNRWNAIFIGTPTHDPYEEGETPQAFHLKATDLLNLAIRNPPKSRMATVANFADWIYSLYAPPPKIENIRSGKKMEQPIFEARHDLFLEKSFQDGVPSGYDLVHSDLGDPFKSVKNCFEIPDLIINGKPLNASPDLLYINRDDRKAIIIEVKYTNKPIPSNLWPNVWAQLWAYSKIPLVKRSPSVMAAAEVWGGDGGKLCLRRTRRKNPREDRFDEFFSKLFKIYSSN